MTEYYTRDVTRLPFGVLLGGRFGWPLRKRLYYAARKALGWHQPAGHGRAMATDWRPLAVDDLPATIREPFRRATAEAEAHGFEVVGLQRGLSIGEFAAYALTAVGRGRAVLWTSTATRLVQDDSPTAAWASGLRTDLDDGTVLVTSRGPASAAAGFGPRYRFEMLDPSTPTPEFLRRHDERLAPFPRERVVTLPETDLPRFLLDRGATEFPELIAASGFRKLSAREVEQLSRVRFDFD